tara:strand:+ start:1103 stop:1741 length:639 start_codon:yes stop_codon:yes gene_type:complete
MAINIDLTYKIVLLGECGAGKSSIAEKYINDSFLTTGTSTIGVDFFNKIIKYDEKTLKIQIWDTAGQEKFNNLVYSYFRDCAFAIIVFDTTNYESFKKVEFWLEKFQLYTTEMAPKPFILVGSKSDMTLIREVTQEEATLKAQELECIYIECSSKNGTNIDEIFDKSTEIIYNKVQEGILDPKKTEGIRIQSQIESFYLHQDKPVEKCCVIL